MSRIRVLQVIQNLNYGGMERLLADIVRRADPARFEMHVLVLQYLGRFGAGLEQYGMLHQASPSGPLALIWPRRLAAQLRAIAPDVVHSHSGVWRKTARAARLAGVPRVIHTDHGRRNPDPWDDRLIDRLAARDTDVVAAVSDALARHLVAARIVPAERVVVVRNGVDTAEFRPRQDDGRVRRELGIAAAAPVLGSVGRLESIKGYDVMIEAFGRLRAGWDRGEPPVLVLGGEGSERPRLERRVEELGLSGGVKFLGWRDDIHDLLACFTLFTMSSRSEGTSVSLLEAMSSGCCPVVTNVGGNAVVLGPLLAHRLVPSEEPEALSAAWRAALADPAARERDEAAARARVQQAFSLEAMVQAYEALYSGASAVPRRDDPASVTR